MRTNCWYFILPGIILLPIETTARSIWTESFSIPEKGTWGGADGASVYTDMRGIDQWTLNTDGCSFTAENDYVKTVSTSGGRLEALDCDGEAVWRSEWIRITGERNVSCRLVARETGSGANVTRKYVHVFYRLNNGPELLFETNGSNEGNWGEAELSQAGMEADSLQLVIRLNSSYASDKVIVDEIRVEGADPPLLPENLAAAGDVLINEILFNPYPDADDFLEVVNVSGKSLRTDHLFVASRGTDGNLKQIHPFTNYADYLTPDGYLLLSENPDTLSLIYPEACPENFLCVDLPAWANNDGVAVLVDDSLNVIDELSYSSKMHHPLLVDENGVSLERKSLLSATADAENWTSAAAASGFATPGCPNSMREDPASVSNSFSLEPKVISPNNDGYNDFTSLHFELSEPESFVNLLIFDASGRLVDQPLKNVTIGQITDLTWDGKRSDGQQLVAGIYVFYIELTNLKGERKVFKECCTIVYKII